MIKIVENKLKLTISKQENLFYLDIVKEKDTGDDRLVLNLKDIVRLHDFLRMSGKKSLSSPINIFCTCESEMLRASPLYNDKFLGIDFTIYDSRSVDFRDFFMKRKINNIFLPENATRKLLIELWNMLKEYILAVEKVKELKMKLNSLRSKKDKLYVDMIVKHYKGTQLVKLGLKDTTFLPVLVDRNGHELKTLEQKETRMRELKNKMKEVSYSLSYNQNIIKLWEA